MRLAALCLALVSAGCQAAGDETAEADGAAQDTLARDADTVMSTGALDRSPADSTWPATGPIDYRRSRSVDFTGDGEPEDVVVTARGRAYDSLDIALTITAASGDTLWREAWPSLLYFKYDPIEGKPDSTVRGIVRDHVEQLLANDRFTMRGGLPAVLSRGGNADAIMHEAIHYHLAELDWRREAGLAPAAPTPTRAYSEISTDSVSVARVDAVLEDVRDARSFMYFAGGEATYAIAWSDRENAFVRISSCC